MAIQGINSISRSGMYFNCLSNPYTLMLGIMHGSGKTLSGPGRVATLLGLFFCLSAFGQEQRSRDEIFKSLYPDCIFERRPLTLSKTQLAAIRKQAGTSPRSPLVFRYLAMKEGKRQGTLYFDTHKVRTLPETLLIAIDANGKIRRVEVVSFKEPEEYLPSDRWRSQFDRKDNTLPPQLGRDIRSIAGATLSARASTDAVRRVLAIHALGQ